MHAPIQTNTLYDGEQRLYRFPNGYGASVVRHTFSYGHSAGLWELAVTDGGTRLVYDTPITNDVIGYLDESGVEKVLDLIAALSPREG